MGWLRSCPCLVVALTRLVSADCEDPMLRFLLSGFAMLSKEMIASDEEVGPASPIAISTVMDITCLPMDVLARIVKSVTCQYPDYILSLLEMSEVCQAFREACVQVFLACMIWISWYATLLLA